jgi:hypothetical protein
VVTAATVPGGHVPTGRLATAAAPHEVAAREVVARKAEAPRRRTPAAPAHPVVTDAMGAAMEAPAAGRSARTTDVARHPQAPQANNGHKLIRRP